MASIITLLENFEQPEAQRLTGLTFENAVQRIEEFCPGFDYNDTKMYPRIYRGSKRPEEAYVCQTDVTRRTSANAVNSCYNIIMSANTDYPDRLESLIGTTDLSLTKEYTGMFGTSYVVIPRAGTVVGVCPKEDVFYCFPVLQKELGIGHLGEFADAIDFACNMANKYARGLKTLKDWKLAMAAIDRVLKQEKLYMPPQSDIDRFGWANKLMYRNALCDAIKAYGKGGYQYLLDRFDPATAGFKTFRYGVDVAPKMGDKEVWLKGECLLIKEESFRSYHR